MSLGCNLMLAPVETFYHILRFDSQKIIIFCDSGVLPSSRKLIILRKGKENYMPMNLSGTLLPKLSSLKHF